MSERISPFLILGLDYDADPADAERAFSKKVRALRELASAPFDREDLTWALNAIQSPSQSLATSVEFVRVPAGRAPFGDLRPGDIFCPPPIPLSRETLPMNDDDRREIRTTAAITALEDLFSTALNEPYNPYGSDAGDAQ